MICSNEAFLLDITNARIVSSSSFKDIDINSLDTFNSSCCLSIKDYETVLSRIVTIEDVMTVDDNRGWVLVKNRNSDYIICRAYDLLYTDKRLVSLSQGWDYLYIYKASKVECKKASGHAIVEYLLNNRVYSQMKIHSIVSDVEFVDKKDVRASHYNRFYLKRRLNRVLKRIVDVENHHASFDSYLNCSHCSTITNSKEKFMAREYCRRCYKSLKKPCDCCHREHNLVYLSEVSNITNSTYREMYKGLDIEKMCGVCDGRIHKSCSRCKTTKYIDFDKLRDKDYIRRFHDASIRSYISTFHDTRQNKDFFNVLGTTYCLSCSESRLNSYLHSPFRQSRLPNKFPSKTEYNRFIGVESEVITEYADSEEYLDSCGDIDKFEIVEDGSLSSGGVEFVSYPMIGNEIEYALNNLEGKHDDDMNYVDSSCGIHIHMNALDFNFTEIQSLLMIMSKIQYKIFQSIPSNRRTGSYCKEMTIGARSIARAKTLTELVEMYYDSANDRLTDNKYNDARYFGTNLHSRFYMGTIEFRYHEGSTEARPIIDWIRFINRIMTASKNLHNNPKIYSKIISKTVNTIDIIREISGVWGADYIERRIYNN